jgi:hypothetical protein
MPVKRERDVIENLGEQLSLLPPNTGYMSFELIKSANYQLEDGRFPIRYSW